MIVRRRVVGVGLDDLLEAPDGVVEALLSLADQAEVVARDHVLRVDLHRRFERARRLVEPALMEERDREPEVRRRRERVELERPPRRAPRTPPSRRDGSDRAPAGSAPPDTRRRAAGSARTPASRSRSGRGDSTTSPRSKWAAGLSGLASAELEAAVAHALGEAAASARCRRRRPERRPAVLAVVVVRGVVDAAIGAGSPLPPVAHVPPFRRGQDARRSRAFRTPRARRLQARMRRANAVARVSQERVS